MVCDQLAKIQQTDDLFAAPFRDDGTTHGTPIQTWALVVDGEVDVRAGQSSGPGLTGAFVGLRS